MEFFNIMLYLVLPRLGMFAVSLLLEYFENLGWENPLFCVHFGIFLVKPCLKYLEVIMTYIFHPDKDVIDHFHMYYKQCRFEFVWWLLTLITVFIEVTDILNVGQTMALAAVATGFLTKHKILEELECMQM